MYINFCVQDYRAKTTLQQREPLAKRPKLRLFITKGGLTIKDQVIITKYIRLLMPFKEVIRQLQSRTKVSNYRAIQEIIINFKFLLNKLKQIKEHLAKVDYIAKDTPKDYLITNINTTHKKLLEYYNKLNTSLVYYTIIILYLIYKHYLNSTQKVPNNQDKAEKGPYPQQDQLLSNYQAFLVLQKLYKD